MLKSINRIHQQQKHLNLFIHSSIKHQNSNIVLQHYVIRSFSSKIDNDLISNISLNQKIKAYLDLSKFRLSSLVVLTTAAGFICTGTPLNYALMASACFGTALCAASAGTFNQIIEKEQDSNMKRTQQRPLPSGKVSIMNAKAFGILTGISGTSLLYFGTNPIVAGLGLTNIILYSCIYTYSKQYTEYNTWIGALVGAIPPVMGWVAAAQPDAILSIEPFMLASILFLWQFPHFFALSWLHREDYRRGNFYMISCNDPLGIRTSKIILEYSIYLTALPIITSVTGLTSYMFAVEGTAANMYLLYLTHKFHQNHSNANARKIFLCSLWYLPLLLTGYVFHSRIWDKESDRNKNLDTIYDHPTNTISSTTTDELKEVIGGYKETLKGLCIHELISNSSNLCPKVATDKSIENVENIINDNKIIAIKVNELSKQPPSNEK